MKNNYSVLKFAFLLFLTISFNAISQSETRNTFTVNNCGCPGEVWNFSNPFKPYIYFPAANNSKRLMHTDYGFNIPLTSTITGIQVDFAYYCFVNPQNNLRDSACKLLLNSTMITEDKAPQSPTYGNSGSVTFGGPGDMWMASFLTPANINDPTFGFNFQLWALGPNISFDFSSGAAITVYYNLASGVSEFQRSSQGIKAYYFQKQLQIELELAEKTELEITDLSGKKAMTFSFESANKNTADLSQLEKGIYIYKINSGSRSKISRIVVE